MVHSASCTISVSMCCITEKINQKSKKSSSIVFLRHNADIATALKGLQKRSSQHLILDQLQHQWIVTDWLQWEISVSEAVPGSVWRQRHRRSLLPPWTALPAWLGWYSPRIYWPDLYAVGWSTCHRFGWTHPGCQGATGKWEAVQVWDRQDGATVSFYLPHGFDSLLEQMEVAVSAQVTWTDQMTVEPPELLHLTHSTWRETKVGGNMSNLNSDVRYFFKCNQGWLLFKMFSMTVSE